MIVFSKDWQAFDFESLEIGDSIVSLSPSKFQPEEGKKASDAITESLISSPSSAAFMAAILALYTRLICPAPTPIVMPSLQ